MIERLRLRHWRAFDSIDLRFEPGTTFVVAPNGVGKTSLLLGMAWAIFGDQAKVQARDCIRAGASRAEAEVTILLDDGRRLTIRRTIAERGRPTAEHDLDGEPTTEDSLQALLHDAFGAQPTVAAQLSMMVGGGHVASERALDLEDHLYQAFGIRALRSAAEHSAALAKAAVKQRESVRSVARQGIADRASGEAELGELNVAIEQLRLRRGTLTSALNAANAARESIAAWSRYETESLRRRAALADAVVTARDLGLQGDPHDLVSLIEAAMGRARAEQADVAERITDARARARAAQSALSLLENDEPSCPTCLRPFHGEELGTAVRAQQTEAAVAAEDEARWREGASSIEQRLTRLDKLRQVLSQVPPELPQPDAPRFDGDPDALVTEAQAALQEHDVQTGRLASQRDAIVSAIAEDGELHRADEAQRKAYRHEAITRAVATALDQAADQLTRGYIEPLSQQIRWRWKALFGEEGLQLKPDGTIVRVVGDRELAWDSLSGGERIWARLVTHLLVLATSTRLPFAWFDEPLEHLDPRARRAVAAALATATRTGGPRQLIVTTYEHAIARQLAADVPEASILYIRRPIR